MIIKKIHIDGFGKLVNFDLEPDEQFNLIYGSNEAGKSTLLTFIRAMFYGLNDRKTKDLRDDYRKRYSPWNPDAFFGGYIVFEHRGSRYRINRRFGPTKGKDSTQFINDRTNIDIALQKNFEPGDHLFSISEDEFVNTVFVGQMQSVMAASQDIQKKLVALTAGTGPKISPEDMVDSLTRIKKDKYKRGSESSPDRVLEAKLEEARQDLEEATADDTERIQIREQIEKLNQTIADHTASLNEVKLSLSTENKQRQKEDYEAVLAMESEVKRLKQELDEHAALIGEEPWPDQVLMSETQKQLQNWDRLAERIETYRQQVTNYEAVLASYPDEETLTEQRLALLKHQEGLQALVAEALALKDLRSTEERAYEDQLVDLNSKLQTLEHELESLEKYRVNNRERHETRYQQVEVTVKQVQDAKSSRISDHVNKISQLKRERDQVAKQKQIVQERFMEQQKRLEELAKRIRQRQADESNLLREIDQTGEQVEAARQNLIRLKTNPEHPQQSALQHLGIPLILLVVGIVCAIIGVVQSQLILGILGAVLLLGAIIVYVLNLQKKKSSQAEVSAKQERINQATNVVNQMQSILHSHEDQLRARREEIASDRNELEQSNPTLTRLTQDLESIEQEHGKYVVEITTVEAQDETELLKDLVEREQQYTAALRDMAEKWAKDKQDLATQIEAKKETLTQVRKQIEEMQFKLSDTYTDRERPYAEAVDRLRVALADLGIEDPDALKAAIDRLNEQMTKRQATVSQIQTAQTNLDQSTAELQKLMDTIKAAVGRWIDIRSLDAARESWALLDGQLQQQQALQKERNQVEERMRLAMKGMTAEELNQAIVANSQWFEANKVAVENYRQYGSEALRDQEADLAEYIRSAGEERGSKQHALDVLSRNIRLPMDLESDIAALEEEYDEILFQATAIDEAIRMIQDSDTEIRQTFGPQIDQKTNEYLALLTGVQNEQLKVSSQFTVQLSDQDSLLHEHQYFSDGKIDQIYLALRLAIGESIYDADAELPFFYDDILVQYDKQRASHTMDFLVNHSREQNRQVFFVSCHDYIRDRMKEAYGVEAITMDI